jgi:hypothetical protein
VIEVLSFELKSTGMARVIELLSFELKSTGMAPMTRGQMDNTRRESGRDLNSPIRYALGVIADAVEVAIASRRVAADPTRTRDLLENWRR